MNAYWGENYWEDDYWEDDYWPITIDAYTEVFLQTSEVTLELKQTSEVLLEEQQTSEVTLILLDNSRVGEE